MNVHIFQKGGYIINILVIGANGAVGKKVISQLKDTEHTSIALVRKEEQVSDLEDIGADKVVIGDLESDFSHAFEGADSVIFTAGSGGKTGADKTILVDLWGSKKSVDLAEKNNVRRFIQLSATDSPNPDGESDVMRPYAVAKHVSDYYIKNSNLDYTIVHPGPLQDDVGTGKIEASLTIEGDPNSYTIPREDVANVLINALQVDSLKREAIFIKSGNTEIKDALNELK
ncbi:SDR family oxidoreductase [Salinicoccus carnicancri]|uniref:SDR family oxidoreductase n=1 Tax=Salinicoccus carnicancri TaxID=558170 RepID=UPI0002E6E145|nr:SDR family oxidoreductase [Salinicoccus carnicancri]